MWGCNCCFKTLIVVAVCSWVSAILRCGLVRQKQTNPKFYRVKSCYRLNTSIIARANMNSFTRCLNFAIEKKGLGFNFSPAKSRDSEEDYFFTNCEVLGCPDVYNLTKLINDTKFDYYTLYGNTDTINLASCVPTVGLFQVNLIAENYSRAENICKTAGGNLADVLSETRTTGLSNVVATRVLDWYKAAYVGLNDIQQEGVFVTPKDEPLNCFNYRAWAPGQPRAKRKKDDCVIIDADKTWRAINCAKQMPFICELAPKPPFWTEYSEFGNSSCKHVRNRTLRRRCKKIRKKFKRAQKEVNYDVEFDEERCDDY